jgi:hypothetical protein
MKEKLGSLLTFIFCLILGGRCPAETLALAFHKRADTGALKPLLLMPMDEKLRYIQNHKIELVRVTSEESSTTDARFTLVAHGADFRPAILLSTRADDWAVLREFMRSRISRDYGEEHSPTEIQELQKIISTDRESKKDRVAAFVRYANLKMAGLLGKELEDLVIEAHLRRMYETEKPLGFDERNYDRSMSFISKTGSDVLAELRELSLACRQIEKNLKPEDKELDIELESAEAQISQLTQDVLAFSDKVRIYMPH